MGYILYNLFLLIAFPFIVLILIAKPRCRRGFMQRLGWVPSHLRNLDSPILWVHAVSLGEVMAVLPLAKALHEKYPQYSLVVSTVTDTGREAVERGLAGVAHHCYCPLDFPWAVHAYVRCLRPVAFLIVETELWPNLLKAIARLEIPGILVNGRLSSRSFARYRFIRRFMKPIMSSLRLCLMQSKRDVQRIIELGANPKTVIHSGNMKFDQVSEIPTSSNLSRSNLGLADHERLFIAGSTHSEEEEKLLQCYVKLCKQMPSLVLLIAPRHIERVQHLEDNIARHGLLCIRKSLLQPNHENIVGVNKARVIILDTRGELAAIYALGWIAFVGGTLIPIGGHNLLEPARWGIPVFFGPYTDHCAEVAELLTEAGGGIQVRDEEELYMQIIQASKDISRVQRVGHVARDVLRANRGAVTKNLEQISSVMNSVKADSMESLTSHTPSLP